MSKKEEHVKSCPFCGIENVDIKFIPASGGSLDKYICVCRYCGSEGPCKTLREKAIEMWNSRKNNE